MSNIDKQALLGADKHANQHRLSRLIIEANNAELRAIAEAVEQYTDQLIAALEAEEKRIAEQREYYEGVIADGSKRIAELEARTVTPPKNNVANVGDSRWMWYQRDLMWIEAIRAAGIKVKGE